MNTVLNEHQLVLDIVAFVALGDFPRSRLSEKQRGKVLASWVSRRMRTIAQFSIRDPEVDGSVDTLIAEERMARRGSGQSGMVGSGGAQRGISSLRQVESLTSMPLEEEPAQTEGEPLRLQTQSDYLSPADARESMAHVTDGRDGRNDDTPTNETPRQLDSDFMMDGSSAEKGSYGAPGEMQYAHPRSNWEQSPPEDQPGTQDYMSYRPTTQTSQTPNNGHGIPQLSLSPVSPGGVSPQPWGHGDSKLDHSPVSPMEHHPGNYGGLRVTNHSSDFEEDNWSQEALRQMNLGD